MKILDEVQIVLRDEGYEITYIKADNTIDLWVVTKTGLSQGQMLTEIKNLADGIFEGWTNILDQGEASA